MMNLGSTTQCIWRLTGDAAEQLPGKILNLIAWKRSKVVLLEEVIHTHAEQFRHEAYVIPMVKPVQEVNTFAVRA